MSFSDPALGAKYRQLGFKPTELGMELHIGSVELSAVEHPLKGVVVFFTSVTPRTATQFEVGVATACSAEQIAGIIYANFRESFQEQAEVCQHHFESLNIEPFDYLKNR